MQQWDGNNYQAYARLSIGIATVGLIVERFRPQDEMFAMCLFFILIGLLMVPEGPKAPD